MPQKQILKVQEKGLREGTIEQLRRTILEVVEQALKNCKTEQSYCIDFQGQQIVAQEIDLQRFVFHVSSYITLS